MTMIKFTACYAGYLVTSLATVAFALSQN